MPTSLENLSTIAVIADTHGKVPPEALRLISTAQLILHAGDICDLQTLQTLQNVLPTVAVRGNNDFFPGLAEVERLTLNGVRFLIHHYPATFLKSDPDSDWYIFGHIHRPVDEIHNGCRHFNPGTVGKPNKGAPPSLAILHWRNGQWQPQFHPL